MIPNPYLEAQLDVPSDWRPGGCRFNPRRGRQHSFVENDHEIFSAVILSLLLIQEGQHKNYEVLIIFFLCLHENILLWVLI